MEREDDSGTGSITNFGFSRSFFGEKQMKKMVSVLALAGTLAFMGVGGAQANHDAYYPSAADGTASGETAASNRSAVFGVPGFIPKEAPRRGDSDSGLSSAMLVWGAVGVGALGLGAGNVLMARRRASAEA